MGFMIGVICPSQFEYEFLEPAELERQGARVVVSGMGKVRAASACGRLHSARPDLRAILLVGFAGGLTPNLRTGDVVEPDVLIEQDYNAEPFEEFPNVIRRADGKLLAESVTAAMLTQDRFLKENPYRDGPYAREFPRLACDMESYAVAHYCREAGLGCGIVKLISDAADAAADRDFLKACRELAPALRAAALGAAAALRRRL
jgi:nucleoside phosphorylase